MTVAPLPEPVAVPGLAYLPDYLSAGEAETLAALVDGSPWRTDIARRVQHYGWLYDYRARRVDTGMYLGPLPLPFRHLAARLAGDGIFPQQPDQLIVNEYLPGQGIAAHTDCRPCFGEVIASISLLAPCEMEFTHPGSGRGETLWLQPRSLLVLSGEARHFWRHAIRPRHSDPVEGGRRQRRRRLSLTFRTVRTAMPDP